MTKPVTVVVGQVWRTSTGKDATVIGVSEHDAAVQENATGRLAVIPLSGLRTWTLLTKKQAKRSK